MFSAAGDLTVKQVKDFITDLCKDEPKEEKEACKVDTVISLAKTEFCQGGNSLDQFCIDTADGNYWQYPLWKEDPKQEKGFLPEGMTKKFGENKFKENGKPIVNKAKYEQFASQFTAPADEPSAPAPAPAATPPKAGTALTTGAVTGPIGGISAKPSSPSPAASDSVATSETEAKTGNSPDGKFVITGRLGFIATLSLDMVPWFEGKAHGGKVSGQENSSTDEAFGAEVGLGMYYCAKMANPNMCWFFSGQGALGYTYTSEQKNEDGSFAIPKDDDIMTFALELQTGPFVGVNKKVAILPYIVADGGYIMGVGKGSFVTPMTGAQIDQYSRPLVSLGLGLALVLKVGKKSALMISLEYKRMMTAVTDEKVTSTDGQASNKVGISPDSVALKAGIAF